MHWRSSLVWMAMVWAWTLATPLGAQPAYVPADLAARLKEEPKTDVDKKLAELISTYQDRLTALDANDANVKSCLPQLRANVVLLYREYNLKHDRYPRDCFTPAECVQYIENDMKFCLDDALATGISPWNKAIGRWQGKVFWIDSMNILGRYDIILPREYDPGKPAPVIYSFQDNPDDKLTRATPYIEIRGIQKGYPVGLTNVEAKTRGLLKHAASQFNIDPFRIYATGFSYGGHTAEVIAWRFPHWFAAIVPVCSDLRDELSPYVRQLKNVPTFLLHGSGDSFIGPGKLIHQWMVQAGCPVRFETYPGGHDPVPFRNNFKLISDFCDQHVLDPYPKMISKAVEHPRYSRGFWANAMLSRNDSTRGIFELRVKQDNRIEIDANADIAALDLYLNEKLLDMAKPVKVVAREIVEQGAGKEQPGLSGKIGAASSPATTTAPRPRPAGPQMPSTLPALELVNERVVFEGKAMPKLRVTLRPSEPYDIGTGDTLWQDIVDIRKAAPPVPPRPASMPASAPASKPAAMAGV